MIDYFRKLEKNLDKKIHDFLHTPSKGRFNFFMFVKVAAFCLFTYMMIRIPVTSRQDLIWLIVGLSLIGSFIFFGFQTKRPKSHKHNKKSNSNSD